MRRIRRECHRGDGYSNDNKNSNNSGLDLTTSDYRPSLIFDNKTTGNEAVKRFAEYYLLSFVYKDLTGQYSAPGSRIPRPGIEFRHVLGIS